MIVKSARVNPNARVGKDAWVGPGAIVEAKAVLHARSRVEAGAVIEAGAIVGTDAVVDHGAHIGANCFVAANAYIGPHASVMAELVTRTPEALAAAQRPSDGLLLPVKADTTPPVVVEINASVLAGAVVLPGVRIGPWAVVMPNSVVNKAVPPNAVVRGAPAEQIGLACKCGRPLPEGTDPGVCTHLVKAQGPPILPTSPDVPEPGAKPEGADEWLRP